MSIDKLMKEHKQRKKEGGGSASLERAQLNSFVNKLFDLELDHHEDRYGLHASAIIAGDSEFCLREQVLSLFYRRDKGEEIPIGLKRIFEAGNSIHEKYQHMFEVYGKMKNKMVQNEKRRYMPQWDLYMTPDTIAEMYDCLYVVEIKSMNMFAFQKLTDKHNKGTLQCKFYMYMLGVSKGMVLCEDKNTQEIACLPVELTDDDLINVMPKYLQRLEDVQEWKAYHKEDGSLPEKCDKCKNIKSKRAEKCPMRSACFNISREIHPKLKKEMENE